MSWLSLQFNWGEGYADRPIVTYVAIYLSLFALYAFACGVVFSGLDHPGIFPAMVLLGLLFRAAVLPSQQIQEDDVYRYLWDGKVFAHGINPYEYAPSEIHERRSDSASTGGSRVAGWAGAHTASGRS